MYVAGNVSEDILLCGKGGGGGAGREGLRGRGLKVSKGYCRGYYEAIAVGILSKAIPEL